MRILVTALGAPGHAFPLVPLAVALRDAGHDTTFATGPELRDTIASTGLPTVVVGGPTDEAFGIATARLGMGWESRESGRAIATETFGDVLPRRRLADLRPWVATHRPDLVVAELGDPGAALAAAAEGVPCVLHPYGRRSMPGAPMYHRAIAPVAALGAELGLPLAAGDPIGHAYLDICPPSLQDAARGDELVEIPLRPTPWNPPVRGVPAPDGPWVYLTLGTAWGDAEVLRTVVGALAGLDVDVLVAAGSADLALLEGVAGDRVRVEAFVAQADLLMSDRPPAVVVHHGGSGTTLAAAAAGVPQLVLPQGADQFFNAAAITAVGAGVTLDARSDDAATIADAARSLLGAGPARAAAHTLAAEIAAMPSPAEVAARVAEWGQPEM